MELGNSQGQGWSRRPQVDGLGAGQMGEAGLEGDHSGQRAAAQRHEVRKGG